jgi:hypothetical protein
VSGINKFYGFSIRAIKDPEAVDMGSGVKWATGNLTKNSSGNYSIASATDYGAYFSWGNTNGQRVAGQTDSYSFDSTTYNSTTGKNLTANFTSGSTTYDAARVRLGSPWRIPTYDELNWLKNNCTWNWKASGNTDYNGVAGYEVVGTNSNKIFLPAAGYYNGASLYSSGAGGDYWSTGYNSSSNAYDLYFDSSNKRGGIGSRSYGRSIRAIKDPEAVDLGSGVKWATGNLTKDSSGNYSIAPATDYGAYFSWGNTNGQRVAGQSDSYSFD